MADNTTLNTGTGGNVIRTLEDGSSVQWPVGVVAYATTVGTPDVLTIPVAAALADATANPTTLLTGCCLELFNGTTWDRVRGDTTNGIDVDVTRLPALVASSANIGDVDVLTVPADPFGVNADAASATGSISAKLRFIAATGIPITGTVAVTQSGTWNVGTVTTVTTVSTVSSVAAVIPGTGATNLGKAEDAAHVSGDTGVMSLSVRKDTATQLAGTDGDYAPIITDSAGRLHTRAMLVDSSGNEIVLSTQYSEDTASVADELIMMMGVVRKDTPVSLVAADGRRTEMLVNANGALWVAIHGLATNEDTAHTSADPGVQVLGVRKATPVNLSGADGDYEPFQVNGGRLWVDASGVTLTVGSHAVTNAGTFAVQIDAGAVTSLALLDDVIFTDDAAFTPGTSKVSAVGFQADESSTDSVDEGDIGCPRMTLDRKILTVNLPHTSGGCSPYSFLSTAAVQAAEIKASAGQVYAMQFFNINAAARYVRIYNQTGAPGTGDAANIVFRGMIPGNTAAGGFIVPLPGPIACGTGIGIRVTAAVADNDNTALAANEIMGNVQYK